MGYGKTYKTQWLEDLSGNQGTANQVLISTSTGIAWATASGTGIIGGPYLPLSAGTSYPLTGDLYVGTSTAGTDRFIRAYYSDSSYTEVRGYGIIANRTTVSYYRPVNDKTQILAIGNDGNTWNYISQNANYHTFGKDTSEWMRIDTSGNVGIGTTSPGGKLDIAYTGTGGTGTFGIGEGLNIYSLSPNITFNDNSSGVDNYSIHLNQNVFTLGRYTSATSQSPDLVLANGNVGIGLTNPADRLDLYDSDDNVGMYFHTATSGTGYGSGLRVGQNNTNAFVWNYEATPLSLATSGTARLTINATGGIRFNTGYGAGTLVTDASGNITVSSGGGAGGPYLPLAGGTMTLATSPLILPGEESNQFKIAFTGASASSGLSTVDQSGAGLYIGANSRVNNSGVVVYHDSALPSSGIYFDGWDGDDMEFYTGSSGNPTKRLTLSAGGDAIFTGNVGIGTTSPVNKLNVNGDIGYIGVIGQGSIYGNTGNSSYANMQLYDPSTGYSTFNNQSYGYYFLTGGGTKMTILNNGNVGIGTDAPNAKLEVAASATTSVDIAHFSNSNDVVKIKHALDGLGSGITSIFDASNNEDIRLSAQSNSWINSGNVGIGTSSPDAKLELSTPSGTESKIRIRQQSQNYWDLASPASDVDFTIGDVSGEKMRIDSSGNVGIGTTSPSAKLTVEDNSSVFRVNTSTSIYPRIELGGSATGSTAVVFNRVTSSQDIKFGEDVDTGRYIFRGGKVGIGTGSPNRSLHVIGQVAIDNSTTPSGGLLVSPDGTSNKVYSRTGNATSSAHPLDFISGSSTSMRIDTSGNVGIGTTSPNRELEVRGGGNVYIKVAASTDNDSSAIELQNTQETWTIRNSDTNDDALQFESDTLTAMTIRKSGNVGVGTTSPQGNLHVVGATGDQGRIYVSDKDAGENSTDSLLITKSGTNSFIYNRDSGDLNLGSNDQSSYVAIKSDGNVGIGTTSPSQRMVISGEDTNPILNATSVSSASLLISNSDTAYGTYIASRSDGSGIIQQRRQTSATYYALSLNPYGGNVGIGTVSPGAKLEVDSEIRVSDGSDYTTISTSGGDTIFGNISTGSNNVRIFNGGSERMRITSTGNVGIGTTSPAEKLHVEGNVYMGAPTGGSRTIYTGGDADLHLQTNTGDVKILSGFGANNLMTLNAAGNVGIGTGSPNSTLQVDGEIDVSGGDGYRINGRPWAYESSDNLQLGDWDGEGFSTSIYDNNSSEVIRVTNGKVGIGTTSPGGKLHLSGISQTGSQDVFRIENDTSNTKLQIKSVSGDYNLQFKNAGNTTRVFLNSNGDSYLNGGNVGIGTTSPSEKLEVDGNVKADSFIKDGGTSSQYLMADGSVSASGGTSPWVATTSPTGIKYTAGKVGIGTDPSSQQDLAVGSNGIITGAIKSTGQSRLDGLVYCASEVEFSDTIKLGGMTTTAINAISSPSAGLTIYNTTLNTICFYNGSNWQKVTSTTM